MNMISAATHLLVARVEVGATLRRDDEILLPILWGHERLVEALWEAGVHDHERGFPEERIVARGGSGGDGAGRKRCVYRD